MKYAFTSLAIGQPYLDSAVSMYNQLHNICTAKYHITTNTVPISSSHINYHIYNQSTSYDDGLPGFSFHVNLKVLSLKNILNYNYDYIIYHDADWRITNQFDENKLYDIFNYMKQSDIDFVFERPITLEYYKQNMHLCFFPDKVKTYGVMDHTFWDKALIVNEQFFIFKNNAKFRLFVMEWEKFLWYSLANNIRHYPDGFDIGISLLLAHMKGDSTSPRKFLANCFEFNIKSGKLFTKF